MFILAHLSDPHVPPLPAARPGDLLSKRLLGYLSWQRRRKNIHRAEVLERLTTDLAGRHPDHVVVTGDLVNISLPAEFEAAAHWLARVGPPEQVTVVPGNHDAYVAMPFAQSWRHWAGYMCDESDGRPGREPAGFDDFPLVRRRGPLAVVGTSSALPTGPGLATGQLGSHQLDRLERQLQGLGEEGLFRVVLVHHPPFDEATKRRKRLVDGSQFRAVIARAGAELVLHGHDHHFFESEIEGRQGPVPVFGVPSASARAHDNKPGAHYFLHEVEKIDAGWRLKVRAQGFQPGGSGFVERFTRTIAIERPAPAGAAAGGVKS